MKNGHRTLLFVNDSVSPYRIHLLRALHKELASRGIDLKLFLMSAQVPTRPWKDDLGELGFPAQVFRGVHLSRHVSVMYFNPGLVMQVMRERPDWVLVGGGWFTPSAFLSLFASALFHRRAPKIFWVEANLNSMTRRDGPAMKWRRLVLNAADALAVPGAVARDTIVEHCQVRDRPFLPLPNLVNEERYRDRVRELRQNRAALRAKWNLPAGDRVAVWPARLSEQHKGIINFLSAVKDAVPDDLHVVIAGEGPDRVRIERFLAEAGLARVRLAGQQTGDAMLELLALADAALLPSRSDPNPLSVVEALWAGLPLLVSDRCGNWPEAVERGVNGQVVDPSSPASMREGFAWLAGLSPQALRAAGEASARMAAERFGTDACVRRFVDALTDLDSWAARRETRGGRRVV